MTIKILHLDDDPDILEIGRMALELNGAFDILQCMSGSEAVEAAKSFRPHVMLLDMMLPGTTGVSVVEDLRRVPGLSQTPVIFMTARVQKDEVEKLMESGAAGVIPKPFDPVTLGRTILDILDQTAGEDTLAQAAGPS